MNVQIQPDVIAATQHLPFKVVTFVPQGASNPSLHGLDRVNFFARCHVGRFRPLRRRLSQRRVFVYRRHRVARDTHNLVSNAGDKATD
jgi:hypothetical protein